MAQDRLEEFGIYKLASQLFADFWADSEIVMKTSPATFHSSPERKT